MSVTIGTKLGPYEITAPIGAGGMGEVYKARDTRLDRTVAIKVLPAHLADKPEVRERFEREAKAIASLNHPHICTLYDTGHQDGTDFLVMEYLEGEMLATRLLKGPLPLDQVLRYAIEIADALDRAHRKGITHRDLKPGNVMLTKDGTKLLDFGLAKLKEAAAPTESASQMPTLSHNPTAQGTLLGTMQYMAPEQVEGKNDEVDARTDIFAFGTVVYEMATGKKAFEGKTNASLIAKILEHNPPPMSSLQPMTPRALDRFVTRCLAKDPEDRWQAARDVELELKSIVDSGSEITSILAAQPKGLGAFSRRFLVLSLIAFFLVGAAIAGLTIRSLRTLPQPRPVTEFPVPLPTNQTLTAFPGKALALSQDGTQLVYVASGRLYLRRMDRIEATPIPGTEGARDPFFSPDGHWIGFQQGSQLKKIAVAGGALVPLCAAAETLGDASWDVNDSILFSQAGVGILRVAGSGGTPEVLVPLSFATGGIARSPQMLPGGDTLLFSLRPASRRDWNQTQVVIQRLDTGERRVVVERGRDAHYLATGHLVYADQTTLFAVPFDAARQEVTGRPVSLIDSVTMDLNTGVSQYSVAPTGTLAYGLFEGGNRRSLVWVDRDGRETALALGTRAFEHPRISPDGQRVAVGIREDDTDIWVHDLERGSFTRLTFDPGEDESPLWADNRYITYAGSRGDKRLTLQRLADGSGDEEVLPMGQLSHHHLGAWSPDGQTLAYTSLDDPSVGNMNVWFVTVGRSDGNEPRPFLQTEIIEQAPAFSPDGHFLAYASFASGSSEVFVESVPRGAGRWQISTAGGSQPAWSADGREIFYRSTDRMMAVPVETEPHFSRSQPRALFEDGYVRLPWRERNYDVTSDGRRFLMVKPTEGALARTQINVVLNWFEELKKRVPVQ